MGVILKFQPNKVKPSTAGLKSINVDSVIGSLNPEEHKHMHIICDATHDFKEHVQYHDWFYHMSDDPHVYRSGDSKWNQLLAEADELNKTLSPESKAGVKLFLRTLLKQHLEAYKSCDCKDDWAQQFLQERFLVLLRRIDGQRN